MHNCLPILTQFVSCSILALNITAKAADQKIDPTGTWTWTVTTQNGDTRQATMKLKMEGDKLTGTVTGRGGETAIQDAKLKGDEISLVVVRERDGNTFTTKYNGKISGDTI